MDATPHVAWDDIERVLDQALTLGPDDRSAFLEQTRSGDSALAAEIERLLHAVEDSNGFLAESSLDFAAALMARVAKQCVLLPGERFQNYEVVRELGHGGMATVYLAQDLRHGRQVALKVLRPELSSSFGADRFAREIAFAARLNHPRILPLHDSGTLDLGIGEPVLFYAMPYVEGRSLRDRLREEPQLPIPEAIRITSQVADALDSAHRHGVIHRDIKPENILLGEGGALVADFGIAVAISTASAGDQSHPGWIAGTPLYMSPEQMSGSGTIDGRSDIYALGVVAYEMLTGQPPFAGATVTAVLAGTVDAAPPPSLHALRDVIPPAADAVVMRALARPEDRYPTGGEFAEALQRSLVVRRPRRSAALVATAIIALSATVVGTTLLRRPGAASTALHAATGVPLYRPHQTGNLGAYDLYTRGREVVLGGTRTEERQIQAIKYFKQAIAADSTYAAAYAELAFMYSTVGSNNGVGGLSRLEGIQLSQATALKAVAMDSTLADGWAVLGFVRMNSLLDLPSAKAALDRALALDPSSPRVHSYLSVWYWWSERPRESLAEAQRASELDPLSVLLGSILAGALYNSGRYDQALEQIGKLHDVDPPLNMTPMVAGAIYLSKGMLAEAIRTYQKWDDQSPWTARALALAGRRGEAKRMLAKELAGYTKEGGAFDIVLLYDGLGDYDQVFSWLEKAVDDHSLWPTIMWPTFAHLRADPRFERIRQRLNGSGIVQ